MSEAQKDAKHSPAWKFMVGTGLTFLGIVVVFVGILLQHGKSKFDEGYKIGLGDETEYDRRVKEKDLQISKLTETITDRDSEIDSIQNVIAGLRKRMKSKVIVGDTIIYVNDGIALFDGYVTVSCREVSIEAEYPGPGPHATLHATNFEEKEHGQPIQVGGSIGNQTRFHFKGKTYVLVILGCKEYNGQPGVKIAIYRD